MGVSTDGLHRGIGVDARERVRTFGGVGLTVNVEHARKSGRTDSREAGDLGPYRPI